MNFFEHQDHARKRTGRLVVLFVLAVLGIIAAVYVLVVVLWFGVGASQGVEVGGSPWNPQLFVIIAGITALVIGLASLYKVAALRGGGHVVAESLGGRQVQPNTTDPIERRVLNVVEEMAIASGVPVPPVYFMTKETGINAFAAGYAPTDAVIGVTRGCAERLTRDELQGVIAHEFSHILNGDMRLNIRIMGLLHGIVVIGLIGYFVFRTALYTGVGRRSSRDRSNPLPLLALGAGLIAIGSIGTFFGSWIKAAVSRQREYLADASAVQFTRNPSGIAGALKKIGGFVTGSKVANPHAPEMSHMFFGQALTSGFNAMFATHPPLAKRIKQIEPDWDSEFVKSEAQTGPRDAVSTRPHAAIASMAAATVAQAAASVPKQPTAPPIATETIGQPAPGHVARARELLAELHPPFVAAAREPYSARAMVFLLLLNRDTPSQARQLARLDAHSDAGIATQVRNLARDLNHLAPDHRLVLLDLAMPALRELTTVQYRDFRSNVLNLIGADDKVELFEWSLRRIVLHHLDAQFEGARRRRAHHYSLARMNRPLNVVLSMLAYLGHRDLETARAAFQSASVRLAGVSLSLLPPKECTLEALDEALNVLDTLAYPLKESVMLASAACIGADHAVNIEEAELFRAFGESLGCPVPPLLPGQRLA